MYNDNVNSPAMQKWLGEVVDSEDMERHDKWACMIYPRLKILKKLLSPNGLIFVSIGDDEIHNLKIIMNEIFGEEQFIAQLIWNTEGSTDNTLEVKIVHEYILLYAKNIKFKNKSFTNVIAPDIKEGKLFKSHIINTAVKNGKANPPSIVTLPKGFPSEINSSTFPKSSVSQEFYDKVKKLRYIPRNLTAEHKIHYPIRQETMLIKNKILTKPCKIFSGWGNLNKLKQFIDNDCKPIADVDGDFSFFISKKGVVTYQKERKKPRNILSVIRDVGTTTQSKTYLENMGIDFDYPKPVELISYLIKMCTMEESIILDSFAGSGTTAHAILALNKEDGGNRKFILVECEDYADTITAERVRRVIHGIPGSKKFKEPLGGSFTYCTLGKSLDVDEMLAGKSLPDYSTLASYMLYTTMLTSVNKKLKPKKDGLFYSTKDTDYYLLYKPEQKYLLSEEGVLNYKRAERINKIDKNAVVFGVGKHMSQRDLTKMKITFCSIPESILRVG